ncbi:MAG: PspA/IM30 family protein [Gammaproteobacteria bacterium]
MTTIFQRLGDVINANINEFIDRVEDPERMIKQMIREMEENIRQAKEAVIDAVAGEKKLAAELEQHRASATNWREKAGNAVEAGDDYLAREALKRALEHDRVLKSLEPACDSAAQTSNNLKAQLRALEAKLDEAKRKRSSLVARQRAAEARQHMENVDTSFQSGVAAHANFTRMEDKVAEMEARTAAMVEVNRDAVDLDAALNDLASDVDVEAELAALKQERATDTD